MTPALASLLAEFTSWLYLPDPSPVLATLATVAANRVAGDPVWLMLVGSPGNTKTELLRALSGLPGLYQASDITEAGLLSGTSARDRAKGATGGLLREIGERGILVIRDFTTVLSMHGDKRQAILAALREIYDGEFTRRLGSDGGLTFHWKGKLGLLAGCTDAIDGHHTVISTMGERFVFYRVPPANEEEAASRALDNAETSSERREALLQAVSCFFAGLHLPTAAPPAKGPEHEQLVALASFAARCRSPVERDSRREIEWVPDPEAPTRIVKVLDRLRSGLLIIGLDRAEAWRLVRKVGLDCMPAIRRKVIEALAAAPNARLRLEDLRRAVDKPMTSVLRGAEDLQAHGVLDEYALSPWARAKLNAFGGIPEASTSNEGTDAVPEVSEHRSCIPVPDLSARTQRTGVPDSSDTPSLEIERADFSGTDDSSEEPVAW